MSRQVRTSRKHRAAHRQVPSENSAEMNGILDSFHAGVTTEITTDHSLACFFPFLLWLFIFPQIHAFPKAPASQARGEGESEPEVLLLKTYS